MIPVILNESECWPLKPNKISVIAMLISLDKAGATLFKTSKMYLSSLQLVEVVSNRRAKWSLVLLD